MTITDAQLNAKYESGTNRLLTESDRIKLPKLVENIKNNPDYMMIDSDWSSSWNQVTKSRLIESLLINIPVTPIVVFEKAYKSHEVIDGRERLKTIVDFYSNRLTLTGMEIQTDIEGCTYSTLPARIKFRLNNRGLNFINCIPENEEQSELENKTLIKTIRQRYETI